MFPYIPLMPHNVTSILIAFMEHLSLAVRILHLLGTEGPRTANPSRYIRYIYNRVILENAVVRAAAVSALARFGALCDDLLPNILGKDVGWEMFATPPFSKKYSNLQPYLRGGG